MQCSVAGGAQILDRGGDRSDVRRPADQQRRTGGEGDREGTVARRDQVGQKLRRRPARLAEGRFHRPRSIDHDAQGERQILDQFKLRELLPALVLQDGEIALGKGRHRPVRTVDHRRVELHQVDLDRVRELGRVQEAHVLRAAAIVQRGADREVDELLIAGCGHIDLGTPRRFAHHRLNLFSDPEHDFLNDALLGHDDRGGGIHLARHPNTPPRFVDQHPQLAALLVQHQFVRAHDLAVFVEPLDPNHLLGRVLRQPHLGAERGPAASNLEHAVDEETHRCDLAPGHQGLGPPQPEHDLAFGRHQDHAAVRIERCLRQVRHQLLRGQDEAATVLRTPRFRLRRQRHIDRYRPEGHGAADLVPHQEPHQDNRTGTQQVLHRQRQRPVLRRRAREEAHPEDIEGPARLLDDAFHVDPDLLPAGVVHKGFVRGIRRQREEDPGQDALAAPRREGDDRILELQCGRRRHLVGRGRHGPGVEILWGPQPRLEASSRRPLPPEVKQAPDACGPVDTPCLLADLQVETAGSQEAPELFVLLEPVLHLRHVQNPLRVLGQPELERLVWLGLEEDQVLVLALLRPVTPDLKRPESLIAVDRLDVVRLPCRNSNCARTSKNGAPD